MPVSNARQMSASGNASIDTTLSLCTTAICNSPMPLPPCARNIFTECPDTAVRLSERSNVINGVPAIVTFKVAARCLCGVPSRATNAAVRPRPKSFVSMMTETDTGSMPQTVIN